MRLTKVWCLGIFVLSVQGQRVEHSGSRGTVLASNSSASSAQDLVNKALAVLAVVNKERVENPVFNEYKHADPGEDAQPAALLNYDADPEMLIAQSKGSRRLSIPTNTTTTGSAKHGSYRIPDEVVKAAALLAESTPQVPEGDHEEAAARIRKKYRLDDSKDTLVPDELQAPEGRLSAFAGDNSNEKRASGYWMIDDQTYPGKSPFSPSGYKVWRNVKDYGAKGDGKTDDTAAINKAISDGARCGETCKTSTIAPAVVYFPQGKYLVSSSIIQYYNTQFLGDPINVPTIVAASSFVGLGVFTSNKYIDDNVGWYLNTANFLRSIKNFKIDIRLTQQDAYVCAIHWQVAQGSSLENIEFYMLYNTEYPKSTQQGIYMENGSGGMLSDLTFVGGNFGAYFGNQQFTTSGLVFSGSRTAVQVHWDWAWTMQDFVIESCESGLVVVGGAGGGDYSTGQGVGSLMLIDSIIANTPSGIVTSLHAENSTSFLLQNVGFFNVKTAITDSVKKKTLLKGGDEVYVDSWGFGRITDKGGKGTFANGKAIPAMNRTQELTGSAYDKMKPNLFTRRRPKYYNVPASKVMNVRKLGAAGDGKTDDTAVLNSILSGAANTSSIVYFPFGVYLVKDTIRVPMGSRIIGQAWSQIMGTGSVFSKESDPQPVVQVGRPQDRPGIIEIQDMMFTVSGATAGAVLVEWNAKESSKGSVGMWDSHFRVGGAIGSKLQKENCPKKSGKVNTNCKAASMLMHLKPKSTAYLENVWAWVADHDLDKSDRPQIDIYVARGILIESSKAWLWGTSSEHCVLYQYQVSDATNIVMGMIQTESPYYQPVPKAPSPFTPGLFPNDPTFKDCKSTDARCHSSWALRVVDSQAVYVLGAGLYSWFRDYSQDCLKKNECQSRAVQIEESSDLWIYNLCTKAILEMVSPHTGVATLAKDNVNGFLSSILAWLEGSNTTSGQRTFHGFQVFSMDNLRNLVLPQTCKTALSATIACDPYVEKFQEVAYRGSLGNTTLTDSVCDEGCRDSLQSWYDTVRTSCSGYNITDGLPQRFGGYMLAAIKETCLIESATGRYCNDVIADFKTVDSIESMPKDEMCSNCYLYRFKQMQGSPHSVYDEDYKQTLEYIYKTCGTSGSTSIQPSVVTQPNITSMCVSNEFHTISKPGATCQKVATRYNASAAALYSANDNVYTCDDIPVGTKVCVPPSCGKMITYTQNDTCVSLERVHDLAPGDIRRFNPWIDYECGNLVSGLSLFGDELCAGPQGGLHTIAGPGADDDTTIPRPGNGYTYNPVAAPKGATVATGTTLRCGKWYVVKADDTCVQVCLAGEINITLFLSANPSLGTDYSACSSKLSKGKAYCVGPTYDWNL